ncbi:MAG: hypothetical protein U1E10_10515 [Bdellovibrionales bacterium]|nr:hypothetical protein [Bdellovibrionales bacterium]
MAGSACNYEFHLVLLALERQSFITMLLWLPTAVSTITCVLFFLFKSNLENKSGVVAMGLTDLLSILYVLSAVLFFVARLASFKYSVAHWASAALALVLGAVFAGLSLRYQTLRVLNMSTALSLLVSGAAVVAFLVSTGKKS